MYSRIKWTALSCGWKIHNLITQVDSDCGEWLVIRGTPCTGGPRVADERCSQWYSGPPVGIQRQPLELATRLLTPTLAKAIVCDCRSREKSFAASVQHLLNIKLVRHRIFVVGWPLKFQGLGGLKFDGVIFGQFSLVHPPRGHNGQIVLQRPH
jgi:hypothetical protein